MYAGKGRITRYRLPSQTRTLLPFPTVQHHYTLPNTMSQAKDLVYQAPSTGTGIYYGHFAYHVDRRRWQEIDANENHSYQNYGRNNLSLNYFDEKKPAFLGAGKREVERISLRLLSDIHLQLIRIVRRPVCQAHPPIVSGALQHLARCARNLHIPSWLSESGRHLPGTSSLGR